MPIDLEKYKLKNNLDKYKLKTVNTVTSEFPTSVPKQADVSFNEKLNNYLSTPAFDMANNQSGLLGTLGKESANIAKSGAKFIKGTADFFNPKNSIDTIKQVPSAASGFLNDFSAAKVSEENARGLEMKVKELTGKNPVAPQNNLLSLTPNIVSAGYETITPEAIKLGLKGEGTKALESLANDPFQVAPVLLASKTMKGELGSKIDKGISKTGQLVTKPIEGATKSLNQLKNNLTKFATSQATGLSAKSIETILKNPDEFSKAKIAEHTRESVGQQVYSTIQQRLNDLSETGKGYETIKKSNQTVTLSKPIVPEVLKKYGIELDAKGKIITTAESVPLKSGDISAIQGFVDQYGKETKLSGNAFLNTRKALSNLSEFDTTKSDISNKIAKDLRSAYDAQGKTQLTGLQELDNAYSPEVKLLKQIKKDYLNVDGTFKDNALSKIANLTKEGRQTVLGRLEQVSPGITKKIVVLNAVEDIANAKGQKVGTYTRAAITGGGLVTGNVPAIVAAIMSSPDVATQIIRGFGKLQNVSPKIIEGAVNSVKNVLTKDIGKLPVGLSVKNVGEVKVPGQLPVAVNKFIQQEPGAYPKALRQGENLKMSSLEKAGFKQEPVLSTNKISGNILDMNNSLIKEAKNYSSGSDFYEGMGSKNLNKLREQGIRGREQVTKYWENATGKKSGGGYQMSHRPSKTGALASDITKDGLVIPKDFYDHPEWYANMRDKTYQESFSVLKRIKDNPDANITIYRASPKNELNNGDWVTLSKSYAKQESLTEKTPVHSFKVKAKDIQFAGDDINEFGYFGKSQLTDIWKKANKKLKK